LSALQIQIALLLDARYLLMLFIGPLVYLKIELNSLLILCNFYSFIIKMLIIFMMGI
jgi:hypothetical protein